MNPRELRKEFTEVREFAKMLSFALLHMTLTLGICAGCIVLPLVSLVWLPVVIPVFIFNIAQWCVIAGKRMP